MFTGIVEETGVIQSISESNIKVRCVKVLENTKMGDSIAVNGVCLTVSGLAANDFSADISPETFNITALGKLKPGSSVNLERALAVNGRLGGHIVTGHIDGTGKIKNIRPNKDFYDLEIELNKECAKYVVRKGSVAINGTSLTIAEIDGLYIRIAIIPHTFENTSLKHLKNGDFVNIETDILAKYVEKFLSTSDNKSGINMEFLRENGF